MDPPDLTSMTAAACSIFRGKAIRPLGFSRRGNFIGEGAASEVGPGVSPQVGAARGWAAPPGGEAGPWPPSVSSLVFAKLW
jgi:hypothetical protein